MQHFITLDFYFYLRVDKTKCLTKNDKYIKMNQWVKICYFDNESKWSRFVFLVKNGFCQIFLCQSVVQVNRTHSRRTRLRRSVSAWKIVFPFILVYYIFLPITQVFYTETIIPTSYVPAKKQSTTTDHYQVYSHRDLMFTHSVLCCRKITGKVQVPHVFWTLFLNYYLILIPV